MNGHNDLTKGNLAKQMWSLAWPMMLSVFFYTLYNIVDAYWVSKLSPDAIAAVSISQISLFLMISLGFGVTVGSGVLMAMELGAKKKAGAEKILAQSFVLNIILGVIFTIISLVFKDFLLVASGATGSIFPLASDYFTVTAAGSTLFFLLIAIMFAFNSQGDTFTLTKMFAFSTALNLVLDPLLIFGWNFIPALGITGAAVATLISQLLFVIIGTRSLSRPERSVQFKFSNLGFEWNSVKQVMNIGFPAALTQVLNPVCMAALTYIVATKFLESGVVAFSLGFRVEFFAYLPAIGYGFAAMAIMGQSIGAHKLDRAKLALKKAMTYSAGIALSLGLLAVIFANQIVGIFTNDPVVVEYSINYFRFVALSYAFIALMMVEANAFQAIGRSWPGFWITVIRLIVFAIPLSLLFSYVFEWSLNGVWLALIIGNVVSAIIGYFWVWRTINRLDFKVVDDVIKDAA